MQLCFILEILSHSILFPADAAQTIFTNIMSVFSYWNMMRSNLENLPGLCYPT